MIYDLIEYFKSNPKSGQMIIDQYILKSGLYIRFNKDGSEDVIRIVKKDKPQGELYDWFKIVDYYSSIADANKAFDAPKKLIHSNNYLALFFKTKSLLSAGELNPIFVEHIPIFYEKMIGKLNSKEVITFSKISGLDEIDKGIALQNMDMVLSKLPEIAELVIEHKLKDEEYVKLFFEEELQRYFEESIRYLYPYIFNTNTYNIEYDDTIYGLSGANMGLNSKKPFLEHKSTEYKVPFRISLGDAMETKKLFEWLTIQQDEKGKPITRGYISLIEDRLISLERRITSKMDMHYVRVTKGIETTIDDYDFLPGITNNITRFIPTNYLMINYYDVETTSERDKMESMVDKYLFGQKLCKHYNSEIKDIKGVSQNLKDLLILSRKAMEDFFIKGSDDAIRHSIDIVSYNLVVEKINSSESSFFTNTSHAMNMRLALLEYFQIRGKADMGKTIRNMIHELEEKIEDKDVVAQCDNDSEFYFAAGQLARYLLGQSEAKKLDYNLTDPLLRVKNASSLKKELEILLNKYSHAVSMRYYRVNAIMSMVMAYDAKDDITPQMDMLIAGIAAKNVVFKEKEEK